MLVIWSCKGASHAADRPGCFEHEAEASHVNMGRLSLCQGLSNISMGPDWKGTEVKGLMLLASGMIVP